MKNIKTKKIILRRETKDAEMDKYQYFISCNKSVEVTTPFKSKATIFNEGEELEVTSNDWKAILAPKKIKQHHEK